MNKNREIQEIPVLPLLKQAQEPESQLEPTPAQDWTTSLGFPHHDGQRRPLQHTAPPRAGDSSSRSVLSSTLCYDSVISEQSSVDPSYTNDLRSVNNNDASYANDARYARNLQLEPVESSRSGSSLGDRSGAESAQAPFARALAKMESAGAHIITARLSEEWDRLDDDDSYQEVVFEKRLWALTAYQRLMQNKHLQSPAHEILSGSGLADQRRILHLHGSLGT
jgi:hypothetical protein